MKIGFFNGYWVVSNVNLLEIFTLSTVTLYVVEVDMVIQQLFREPKKGRYREIIYLDLIHCKIFRY